METNDKVKILVVDDLKEKILVYRTILEELHEDLITAQSGEEALKQVLRNDFAVILLDVNMPGMDGLETAALIRKRAKSMHTPIIFMTAFLDEMRSQEGYAHGAVDYILAPVDPVILRAKVKVFIDLFRMQREAERRAGEKISLAEEHAKRVAAEDSSRASSFLARASEVLSESLELPEIIKHLAHLNVPYLAEICIVSVADNKEKAIPHEWASTHQVPNDVQNEVLRHLGPSIALVIESGQRIALKRDDDSTGDQGTEKLWHLLESLHIQTVFLQPLDARGKTLGSIAFLASSLDSAHLKNRLQLIEEMTARAAISIDNVLLLQSIREADVRKDEFLAMLAHELRNPLAPISNALEILKTAVGTDRKIDQAAELIHRQLKHLTRLVDDLLDVSRITRGKIRLQPESINIATVTANAIETSKPIMDARRHQLHVTLPADPLFVKADSVRLTQVLLNLLNNSAKYTQENGSIWLTVERSGNQAVIKVKDDGEGIPKEMQQRIFDLFTQVNHSLDKSQGGLGIGLTLVKRLVEMHDGTIEVHSQGKGHGSEFIVRLPMIEKHDLESIEAAKIISPSHEVRRRILVVDDNVDSADSLAILLEMMRNEVITANSGHDAVIQAERFNPDIVFLDIGMPRMDGYEVTRTIREKGWGKQMTIIALTGWGQDQDRMRSKEVGIDHHLVKPVDAETIRRLLASPKMRANTANKVS